ncbi:MAG: hypothetical protein IID30_04615 [Planctomycetes bacterium]|nr:hypothetical protein [Planctomycetota bacterium]
MTDDSHENQELLNQLVAGALGGFGESVANNKISPEKAAHKAVLMAEGAILEMKGESILGSMDRQKMVVFEKPDR